MFFFGKALVAYGTIVKKNDLTLEIMLFWCAISMNSKG